jgi:hypothetical protein
MALTTSRPPWLLVAVSILEIVFINHLLVIFVRRAFETANQEYVARSSLEENLFRTPGRILSRMRKNHKDGKVKMG